MSLNTFYSADLYSSDEEDEDLIGNSSDQGLSSIGKEQSILNHHGSTVMDVDPLQTSVLSSATSNHEASLAQANTEDQEEDENPIVLALCYQKGRLGVASFDIQTGELLCGETNENNLFEATSFGM